jgi:hypothetical protein
VREEAQEAAQYEAARDLQEQTQKAELAKPQARLPPFLVTADGCPLAHSQADES